MWGYITPGPHFHRQQNTLSIMRALCACTIKICMCGWHASSSLSISSEIVGFTTFRDGLWCNIFNGTHFETSVSTACRLSSRGVVCRQAHSSFYGTWSRLKFHQVPLPLPFLVILSELNYISTFSLLHTSLKMHSNKGHYQNKYFCILAQVFNASISSNMCNYLCYKITVRLGLDYHFNAPFITRSFPLGIFVTVASSR